ncbi:hypothetical protein BC826DRAFT_1045043 [Russula brevipes]|nr:hypothetical protein BC826DRAFT_1045043 [Russula brevipes]
MDMGGRLPKSWENCGTVLLGDGPAHLVSSGARLRARALRVDPPAPEILSSLASLPAHVSPIVDFLFIAHPTAVNLRATSRACSRPPYMRGRTRAGLRST